MTRILLVLVIGNRKKKIHKILEFGIHLLHRMMYLQMSIHRNFLLLLGTHCLHLIWGTHFRYRGDTHLRNRYRRDMSNNIQGVILSRESAASLWPLGIPRGRLVQELNNKFRHTWELQVVEDSGSRA